MTNVSNPEQAKPVRRRGDRIFSGISFSAGALILITLASVAVFLTIEAIPGITASTEEATILDGESFWSYAWPLVYGTLFAAAIAILIATPLAIAVALFISHYAPRRIGQLVGYVVDLLAAVPSVVYGLWGIGFLAGELGPVYRWLADNLGFIPLFDTNAAGQSYAFSTTGRTIMTASLVLAIMVLPIITAICREVFLQTPRLHQEAALALGATRWEVIRMTVFPYGRSGIIGATMLGLGRALGETMAVAMVLSASGVVSLRLLTTTNPTTIPANIALGIKESSGLNVNVLIASGLMLFIITFLVNFAARAIVARRKEFSGADA
ncbi:MAG: phosphate ABC transporter permease subunit PstC [Nocardioidaceae bacterium]